MLRDVKLEHLNHVSTLVTICALNSIFSPGHLLLLYHHNYS